MTGKLYTKDDIIEKAHEIAHMIANTEEVEFFKRAEAQINENQFVREKIASLKSLQMAIRWQCCFQYHLVRLFRIPSQNPLVGDRITTLRARYINGTTTCHQRPIFYQ